MIYTVWHTLARHGALPILFLDLDRHRVALRRYHHIGGQQRHAEPPFAIASRGQRHAVDPDRLLAADSFQRQPAHGLRRMEYRSEEQTSELQSLMRISYAVFCLKKKIDRQSTPSTSH